MKKSKIGWKKSIKSQYRESHGDEKWKRREYSNNRYRSMTFEEKPNLKVLWWWIGEKSIYILKMSGNIPKVGNAEIKIRTIHYSKELISNDEWHINKSLNADTMYLGKQGFKFFIEYNNNKLMRPLINLLEKLRGYIKSFEEPQYTLILVKDQDFLGK